MMELTAQDGSRLFVNPDAVWHIRGNGADQTAVYGVSGAALFVQGGIDEIADRFVRWRRAQRDRPVEPPGPPGPETAP